MIFLRAFVPVFISIGAVLSLNFTAPAENKIVKRADRTFLARWTANYPVTDQPLYLLGVCHAGQCQEAADDPFIFPVTENHELLIDAVFPNDGNYSLCVFLERTPRSRQSPLYQGPAFQVTD